MFNFKYITNNDHLSYYQLCVDVFLHASGRFSSCLTDKKQCSGSTFGILNQCQRSVTSAQQRPSGVINQENYIETL